MSGTVGKDGFTEKQRAMYDEWSIHYETYEKWLASKPEEHQLFNMSVRNLKRRESLAYYRGFIDAIAHLLAVVQNSIQKVDTQDVKDARATLAEYSRLLLGCVTERITMLEHNGERNIQVDKEANDDKHDENQDEALHTVARNALPADKTLDFYVGFRDGYQQLHRIVVHLYGEEKQFDEPFNVLQSVFYIQSGFVLGLMIENWPVEGVPSVQKTMRYK